LFLIEIPPPAKHLRLGQPFLLQPYRVARLTISQEMVQ
jgi:hypothetical protein